jgi:hypothetical protein
MYDFQILNDVKTRTISCENPNGSKGNGAKEGPDHNEAAKELGIGWKCRPFMRIEPKSTLDMASIEGEGEIKSIWITGNLDRSVIIRMYWDNQEIPSVECPITDFFLYGFARPFSFDDWNRGPVYKVNSELIVVNPNRGFNCYIPMPYRKAAKITLENRSTEEKVVFFQVNYEEKEIHKDSGYFHAQHRVSMPVKYKDVHTIVDGIKGKGTYIGTALYVGLNRSPYWWGEGEVKFYMDGDKEFPTICTTGLEDYFCGAFNWDVESEYQTYSTPYNGLPHIFKPDGLYEIQQRFNLYRWHVVDPIRFDKELKVTVQDLGWKLNDKGTWEGNYLQRQDDFISVAYWYQTLPTQKFPELIPHELYLGIF